MNISKVAGALHGVAVRATAAIHEQFSSGNDAALDREYQGHDYSRVRGPKERAGTGRDPTEEDLLEWDIQKARRELAELDTKIDHQQHQMRSFQASIPEMQSRIAEVQKEIETVNQDLTATRAHAPDEGTMLKGEVVKEFREVGQCINDIINAFMEWYGHHIDRPLSRPRAREIREHIQGNKDMQDSDMLVQLASGRNLWQLAELLLRHCLCLALQQHVFLPFLPGEARSDLAAEYLSKILTTVKNQEVQDRSGRWRALTYKQAAALKPRDESWCAEPATVLVEGMCVLMLVISDMKLSMEAVETAFQLTSRMFNVAAEFKDKATMICTEVDFRVYLPSSNNRYDLRFMEEGYKGRGSSKSIILGVGLGLLLSCNTQQDSTYARRHDHPVLALVIGDKSGFLT